MSLLDRLTGGTLLTLHRAGFKAPALVRIVGRAVNDGDLEGTLIFDHVSFPFGGQDETAAPLDLAVKDITLIRATFTGEVSAFDSPEFSIGLESVTLTLLSSKVTGRPLDFDGQFVAIEVEPDEDPSDPDEFEVRLYNTAVILNWSDVKERFEAVRDEHHAPAKRVERVVATDELVPDAAAAETDVGPADPATQSAAGTESGTVIATADTDSQVVAGDGDDSQIDPNAGDDSQLGDHPADDNQDGPPIDTGSQLPTKRTDEDDGVPNPS